MTVNELIRLLKYYKREFPGQGIGALRVKLLRAGEEEDVESIALCEDPEADWPGRFGHVEVR
jgi:hypothetical protein